MKMIRRRLIAFLVLILVLGNTASAGTVRAEEGEVPPQTGLALADSIKPFEVTPGGTFSFSIPVRALNQYIINPYVSIDTSKFPFYVSSEITLTKPGHENVSGIEQIAKTFVNFDLKIDETAKADTYQLYIDCMAIDGDLNNYTVRLNAPIIIKVINTKNPPSISLENITAPNSVKNGGSFNLRFNVVNKGELTAKSVALVLDGFAADGIIPDYSNAKKTIGTLESNGSYSVSLPMSAAKDATAGVKTLNAEITYTDNQGAEYPAVKVPIYIEVTRDKDAEEEEKVDEDPNVIISNVVQSKSTPKAGEYIKMTFDIVNKSKKNLKEIKVIPSNLTSANFSPTNSEPYFYIEELKAGKRKKLTLNLKISKDIKAGLNEIVLDYTYKSEKGKAYGPVNAKIFVLNVQNPEKQEDEKKSQGTPKIIISNYGTDKEPLKSGAVFMFNFDIQNTHSKLSAKNIKVTLSSEENVFSVTKGSNSFYISEIRAGETKSNQIEMKVKADTTTKPYPLDIKFEYEYEGMPIVENQVNQGVSFSDKLNLQVTENARPSVNNVAVGTWEPPVADIPTTLSFEFYNMGKAVLSNVTAKVESDFFSTSSNMLYIGNVEAGSGDVHEMEITPLMEGQGTGKLIISYEDSNGEIIEFPTDFEAFVNPGSTNGDGGELFPELPPTEEAKKPILPTWAFIALQAVIFIAAIPIARKITLAIYKRKLQKEEDDEL